jgi:hypothetical protein
MLQCCEFNCLQARADGGDEMDDLLSAPRMVLSQFVDKWFPDADSETTAFSTSRLEKLLLDVSSVWLCVQAVCFIINTGIMFSVKS